MAAKVLTIAQQKGGAGKTTLVAQLAVAFSAAGKRVALVDIDPQASLAGWYKVRRELQDPGLKPLQLTEIAGYRAANEVSRLKRDFDLVVIDSPPHAETEAKIAVRSADLLLLPIQPSPMDVWATAATVNLANTENVPVLIVLNRVPPRGKVVELMRERLARDAIPVAHTEIGNRIAFAASMLEGRSVLETAPRSPAAEEIRGLMNEIDSRL